MAMFFSHSRACSFLFAVSFGGIVASAKPLALPHPLAHMFVCVRVWAAFVFSTLSVLRLWSQLRSRHRNRNQKPRNRQTEPWIPLLTPPTGLQMTFELHSGYCYSFERKLCTKGPFFFDTHTLRACELSWVKGKIRLLRPLKCVTFWVCSTSNICSNIYQDYVPGLGKRCPGLDTSD